MKNQAKILICALVLVLGAAATAPARAQGGSIGLYNESLGFSAFDYVGGGGSLVQIYLFHEHTFGATGVSFRFDDPACLPDLNIFGFISPFTTTGSLTSGITIDYGSPRTGPIYLGVINAMTTGAPTDSCCVVTLQAHPDAVSGEVEATGPLGEVWTVETAKGLFRAPGMDYPVGDILPIYPPDGATAVPLTFEISVGVVYCFTGNFDISGFNGSLYLGTDPDPPYYGGLVVGYNEPLAPGTTYYWRMTGERTGYEAASPVYSFTTIGPINTVERTWGRIKALYSQ